MQIGDKVRVRLPNGVLRHGVILAKGNVANAWLVKTEERKVPIQVPAMICEAWDGKSYWED